MDYSKTATLKKTGYRLMQVKSIAESSIMQKWSAPCYEFV